MIAKSTRDFQNKFLNKMTFTAYPKDNYIIYMNKNHKELGYFIKYSRKGYYDFIIGDYTIPSDFSLSFEHSEELVRFGTVYTGETQFKIEDNPSSSFSPSSFFVSEKGLRGRQSWKKGQHFHGAEIIIYKKYFYEIILPHFPYALNFENFITNYTYHSLPIEVVSIIQSLKTLIKKGQLTSLYLESKILECIALISSTIESSSESIFTNKLNYRNINIGKNRTITLTSYDANAIQKAHDILSEKFCNPPTISALSKMVFLNEQKLKAGFSNIYNMSISQYTTSLKIVLAENLLSTTELSIDEIASKVGYNHSGNFIKMFKKAHGKTPLSFRKLKG
ncbi:MAG: AraC family transcriptional regulator [Clostridium sp.]|nr:AraC family transcriptional regulator [Clostridium sp.]